MLEQRVDTVVYNELSRIGLKPKFGREADGDLTEAMRFASKNLHRNPGVVDLFAYHKDILILIEDKGELKKHVDWDTRFTPYALETLKVEPKSLKGYAENGAQYYLVNARDHWPYKRHPINHIISLGISMESDSKYIIRPFYLNRDDGIIVRLPTLDDLSVLSPKRIGKYVDDARSSYDMWDQFPRIASGLSSLMKKTRYRCSDEDVLTTLFLAMGNPEFSRFRTKSVRSSNALTVDLALAMLSYGKRSSGGKTRKILDISSDAKYYLEASVKRALNSGADLYGLSRYIDDSMVITESYEFVWTSALGLDDHYDRSAMLAEMAKLDQKSKIFDPYCVYGYTLSECEKLLHRNKERCSGLAYGENMHLAAMGMALNGNETVYLDEWSPDAFSRTFDANRVVTDLSCLNDDDQIDCLENCVSCTKSSAYIVVCLSKKAVKSKKDLDTRDAIASRCTLEMIAVDGDVVHIRLLKKKNDHVKTLFRDVSRYGLERKIKEIKSKNMKGSKLIKGGEWLRPFRCGRNRSKMHLF